MEKRVEITESKAKIKGLPAWHLTGVSDDAVSAIKDTGFWVHYRSFGLDGWYIAAPNAVLPHFKAALAKEGVGFEAVKQLPRKYAWLVFLPAQLYMMFGWVVAAAGVAHMGKVWLAVTIVHLVSWGTGRYHGRPIYAEMLEPANDHNIHKVTDRLDTMNPDIIGSRGYWAWK